MGVIGKHSASFYVSMGVGNTVHHLTFLVEWKTLYHLAFLVE